MCLSECVYVCGSVSVNKCERVCMSVQVYSPPPSSLLGTLDLLVDFPMKDLYWEPVNSPFTALPNDAQVPLPVKLARENIKQALCLCVGCGATAV